MEMIKKTRFPATCNRVAIDANGGLRELQQWIKRRC